MTDDEKLEPPKGAPIGDPGAHDLAEYSDSEDQFTDAQSAPISPNPTSPIPITRVEKVDNEPSYGEVPGTEAYAKRGLDAQPDEIAIADDAASQDSKSTVEAPVVPTIVNESSGDVPTSSSPGHEEKHKADASPDLVLSPEGHIKAIEGEDLSDAEGRVSEMLQMKIDALVSPPSSPSEQSFEDGSNPQAPSAALQPPAENDDNDDADDADDGDEDDFGEDFEDFEEGNEDDDFDDFEDGFQQAETTPAPVTSPLPAQIPQLQYPIPDFDGLDLDSVVSSTELYLAGLFPPEELEFPAFPPLSKDATIFHTPRSASLWSQLVAPPPLAPPDWIRSRIRRLFLVSLGVPVDLDEILPASKQKKLVLPSLNLVSNSSRTSSDSRSTSRLRHGEGNASSTSVDSQGKKKRRGPPAQPELDLVAARHLCMTTDEALNGMTDEELKAHVAKLEAMEGAATDALEYWKKRTDEKLGDREAFEGVIENLVKHARKVRK